MWSIDPKRAWQAVLDHDRRFDGRFVYAVSSTHIYCRPSCPSRRPARRHVRFFGTPAHAESAGYRACLRCRPHSPEGNRTDVLVDRARRYLDGHVDEPVTLSTLAAQVGLSPWHLQRAFLVRVGLSPKRYHDVQRVERLKTCLKRGDTVTQATYEAGFGSGSRVYERVPGAIGMTPAAFRAGGRGVMLRYGTVVTEVGRLLVAATERGLVAVTLGDSEASLLASLREEYPHAAFRRDPKALRPSLQRLLRCLQGTADGTDLPLDVKATAFQRRVWQALRQIPRGQTRSYRQLAETMGLPTGARAVARACATNPVAIVIPCHRAVRYDGRLAGYRWGLDRKKRLLDLERIPSMTSRYARARR